MLDFFRFSNKKFKYKTIEICTKKIRFLKHVKGSHGIFTFSKTDVKLKQLSLNLITNKSIIYLFR